jgi:hypothetical protein
MQTNTAFLPVKSRLFPNQMRAITSSRSSPFHFSQLNADEKSEVWPDPGERDDWHDRDLPERHMNSVLQRNQALLA